MTTPSEHSKKSASDTDKHPTQSFGHEEDALAHQPAQPKPEDSTVDLGHPLASADPRNPDAGGSQSGISVVDWASLVEDAPAPSAEPPSFDSPSDAELLLPPEAPVETAPEAVHHGLEEPAGFLFEDEPSQPHAEGPAPESDAATVYAVDEASFIEEAEDSTLLTHAGQHESAMPPPFLADEVVHEEAHAVSEDDVAAFLAEAPEPPTATPEEVVHAVEEGHLVSEEEMAAFLNEEPATLPVTEEAAPVASEDEALALDEAHEALTVHEDAAVVVEEGHVVSEDEAASLLDETHEALIVQEDAVVVEEGHVVSEDEAAGFLNEAHAALTVPEENAVVVEEGHIVSEDEAAAFLDEAHAPLIVHEDAAAAIEEEHPVSEHDSFVMASLDDAAELPTVPEAAVVVEEVPEPPVAAIEEAGVIVEEGRAAYDDEMLAFLNEAPEPPLASVEDAAVVNEVHVVSEDAVAAFLEEKPALPPAHPVESPSGMIAAEVDFLEDQPEVVVHEAHPVEFATTDTPQPISEMAQAEEAAFAAPEDVVEEVEFTPEAMFAEHAPTELAIPGLPQAPKMELDSGSNLQDVVELGPDAVVPGQSEAGMSAILGEVVEDEDEAFVAEVAEEGAGSSAVLSDAAEVEDVVEVAEVEEVTEFAEVVEEPEVAEIAEEDVLELGEEAVAPGSSVSLSAVVAEVVESDVAVTEPEVVEMGEDEPSQPLSSGTVAMDPDAQDLGTSGRDFIAEAVESGIDGTLQMPGMEVVDSEGATSPDSAKKMPSPPPPKRREQETTREIPIPQSQPDPDDFFSPVDSGIVAEAGEVVLGQEEGAPAVDSSSIDLGSMPELPIFPSGAKGSEVADIDLAALEQAGSSSQRAAGKASPRGEIDLGSPSSASNIEPEATIQEGAMVDEAEIDFATLEESAGGSGARAGNSTVAFDGVIEPEPTADLDGGEVVEEGVVEDEFDESGMETIQDDELVGAVVGEDEEEEKKPKDRKSKGEKESKPKGRGGAWIGGTLLGTMAGAGACVGLWLGGIEPPKDWRKALGTEKSTQKGTVEPGKKAEPVAAKASAEDLLARNDIVAAKEAAKSLEDNDKKNLLLGRIAYREYAAAQVKAAADKDVVLKADDENVKTAIQSLEAAKTPDAYFELGQIYEDVGNWDAAKKSYEEGKTKAKDDAEKRRFDNALRNVDRQQKEAAAAGAAGAFFRPRLPLDNVEAALISLVLVTLQDAGAEKPKAPEEAGYKFYDALDALTKAKTAKDSVEAAAAYAKAIEALQEAAKLHARRRLLFKGTPQNPESDPREQIFLECTKELTAYWKMRQNLVEKYQTADLDKVLQAATVKAKDEANKAILDKLLAAKVIDKADKLDAGVDALLALRKDLAEKLDAKDADKYDEAIAGFLKKDGGLDQLGKESAALLEVAKKIGAEKDDAKKIGADKLDDVKTRVVELAADGALVKKVGEKLKTDKVAEKIEKREDLEEAVNGLVTEWKTLPGLKDKLKTTETDLTAARAFVDDLAKSLLDAEFLPKDMPKPGAPVVLKAAKDLIDMSKGDEGKKRVVRENADLSMKNTALVKQVDEVTKLRTDDLAKQKKDYEDQITKINTENATEVKKLKDGQATEIEKLNTAHKNEVTGLTTELKQRRSAAEMLPLWLPLLESRDKSFVKDAQGDAERVLAAADKKKDDEARAKVLQGLALRNLGQYAEAEAKLKEAEKDLPKDSPWGVVVAEGLQETKDAVGYYSKKAADLADHNYPEKAIELFDRMLAAAAPEQKGRLLAQRSLLRLEIAMAKGTVEITDDLVKQALADVKEAGDVAAAHYAKGRIQEELKDMDGALVSFEKAVELHKVKDADTFRYEAAKARALLAPRKGPRRVAEPKPEEKKLGRLDRDEDAALALSPEQDQRLALVLLTVMVEATTAAVEEAAPDAAPVPPEQESAEKLADKILADPAAPFDARAQALMVKGRYTDALRVFAEGLQKHRLLRAEHGAALMKIINDNPRLKPKTSAISSPLEAENYYGNGLRLYYAGQYTDAEKQFQSAVDAVDGDDENARYFYFLGLTQIAQGKKREATQNFADGAALERRGLPSRVAVNASLERVQGRLRRILDDERNRLPQP